MGVFSCDSPAIAGRTEEGCAAWMFMLLPLLKLLLCAVCAVCAACAVCPAPLAVGVKKVLTPIVLLPII